MVRRRRGAAASSLWPAACLLLQLRAAAGVLGAAPEKVGFSEKLLGNFADQTFGQAFGVLIGVGNGRLALELLKSWPSGVLFLVDPYIHLRRGYDRPENLQDDDHQRQYEHLRNVLAETPQVQGRFSFVREFSFGIPKVWREKQWGPDPKFIYADANPSYGAVRTDLQAWWPMLASGGVTPRQEDSRPWLSGDRWKVHVGLEVLARQVGMCLLRGRCSSVSCVVGVAA